jgi:glycine cleavage system regulatory protein
MESAISIETLRSDTEELREHVNEIGQNVRDIKFSLLGNDFTGGRGLIQQVKGVDDRVTNLEKTFDKYRNIFLGLSIGAGVGLGAIAKAILEAFTRH